MYSQANLIKKWMLTLLCFTLVACGGSSSFNTPDEIKDTTPPRVLISYPDESVSESFRVDDLVEITFSELMNISSLIDEEGVKLYSGRQEQSDNVDLELRQSQILVTVVPVASNDLITDEEIQIPATKLLLSHASGRFALNTEYTVEVSSPARDLVEDDLDTAVDERNYINSTSAFDFATEKGAWKTAVTLPNALVETNNANEEAMLNDSIQFSPLVVSNTRGDNFVLWRQELMPGINQLWGTRYNANEKKWSLFDASKVVCSNSLCANAEQLNSNDLTNVLEVHASVNENGQLAVVWTQAAQPGGLVSIWASLYDGENWLAIKEVSNTLLPRTGDANSPQVAIDQDGNVAVVWREFEGDNARIKSSLYQLDTSSSEMSAGQWAAQPVYIDDLTDVPRNPPKLAVSKTGLVIAVWAQKSTDLFQIYSSNVRLSNKINLSWAEPKRIDINTDAHLVKGRSLSPAIAIDENDDAIAIWLNHDGQRNNLWYNRFTGSWGGQADLVERNRLGDASFPAITFSRDNRALATWVQEDKSSNATTLLSRFFHVDASDNGWEYEQVVESSNLIIAKPVPVFDREGNAVLLWQDGLSNGSSMVSYYSKLTKTWGDPEELTRSGNDISVAALYEDGRFLSVWQDLGATDPKIHTSIYEEN